MKKNNLETFIEKIHEIHDYILLSYYVGNPNIDISGHQCNDVVSFSLMTGLLNKNQIVFGNPGLGKTTTSQAVSSLLYSLPIEFVEASMIQGHPMLTEEKIMGRLDFSKLNEDEKIIFSLFSQTPSARIIDEINRIPEGTQNLLLKAVENGVFNYLNDSIKTEKPAFFATANYKDGGNTELLPPLLDRFDVSVEVSYPSFWGKYLRGDIDLSKLNPEQKKLFEEENKNYEDKLFSETDDKNLEKLELEHLHNVMNIVKRPNIKVLRSKLQNKDLSYNIQDILTDKSVSYEVKMNEINKLKKEFSKQISEYHITDLEKALVPRLLSRVYLSEDASLLIDTFFDSSNVVLKNKDEQNPNNHFDKYHIGKMDNNLGFRPANRSTVEYSKLLSLLKGETKVSLETVAEVLPYVINHRLEFSDKYSVEVSDFSKSSFQMNKSKKIVQEFIEDDFLKNKELYSKMYDGLSNPSLRKEFVKKNKDSDNPLIRQYCKNFK